MAYAAGTPGVFGTATSVGATQGFTPASTGAAAVAPTFDNSGKEMLGKGLGKMFDLNQQKEKNSNVPKYSRIDETTGLLVFTDNADLSAKYGRPELPKGSAYEIDMQKHTDIFNHNKNIDDLAAEKVKVAKAEAEAKAEEEANKNSVFTNLKPTDIGNLSKNDLANLSTEELLKLKSEVGSIKNSVFSGGGANNVLMGPIPQAWDAITDRFGLQTKALFQNFDLTPEVFMNDIDRQIENIEDASEVWRMSPGAVDYFQANPDAWVAITTGGAFDNEKFMPWFNSMRGKLSLGDPSSIGVQSRNLFEAFMGNYSDYDKSFFR